MRSGGICNYYNKKKDMKENKPFYTFSDSRGIGVFLDGGCGFQLGDFREEDKVHPALRIVPLKYKQEPGVSNC